MELGYTVKKFLSVVTKLPAFGFWHGLWVRFDDYFSRRHQLRFDDRHLILNKKIKRGVIAGYRIYEYLSMLKRLVKEGYIELVTNGFGEQNHIGVHSIFKVTDKGWRACGEREIQKRINYNPVPVYNAHDLLVSAVLLTFHYQLGFQLSRPMKWRRLANNAKCPLPDGVVESPFGEIWAVEVERTVNRKHLEGHINYHDRNSKVLVILDDPCTPEFQKRGRYRFGLAYGLIEKYQLKNWYIALSGTFFNLGGRGKFCGLNGKQHFFTDTGELVDEQTYKLWRRSLVRTKSPQILSTIENEHLPSLSHETLPQVPHHVHLENFTTPVLVSP